MVSVRQSSGVNLHHPRVHSFLIHRQRIPRWNLFRSLCQLGLRWHHPKLDLTSQSFLPDFVPSLIEFPLVLRNPILGSMVWCMRAAGAVVQQPRFIRCDRVLHPHPGNRFVRQIAIEYVRGVAKVWLNGRGVLIQRRVPLIAVAAEKAVEVLEAKTGRPQVERPRLARHPVRYVVHLAEPRGVVAVFPQDGTNRAAALRYQGVVPGEASRELGNDPARDGMMVPSRDQRRTGGRAQRRRVPAVIAKPPVSNPLEIRSLDWTAKNTARPEAH